MVRLLFDAGAPVRVGVRPSRIADVAGTLLRALDAARAAGVRHVVFLCRRGAERNPVVPPRRVEGHLVRHGPAWTLLRPGFFMKNLATTHRRDIAEQDEIHLPAGRGRTSFVFACDVWTAPGGAASRRPTPDAA